MGVGKRVLLIIAGGIAAYKALDVIRRGRERGLEFRVILTKGGAEFVTPLSVASLAGSKAYTELFSLTDEAEMGLTYAEVDQLLYLLVDERYTIDDAVAAGFDRAYVDRVWRLIRTMHFKRRSPLIAKLSKRTVGIDFNYLRDWGY